MFFYFCIGFWSLLFVYVFLTILVLFFSYTACFVFTHNWFNPAFGNQIIHDINTLVSIKSYACGFRQLYCLLLIKKKWLLLISNFPSWNVLSLNLPFSIWRKEERWPLLFPNYPSSVPSKNFTLLSNPWSHTTNTLIFLHLEPENERGALQRLRWTSLLVIGPLAVRR